MNAHGSKWIRPKKRWAIYKRDGGVCAYCGVHAVDGGGVLARRVAREARGDEVRRVVRAPELAREEVIGR